MLTLGLSLSLSLSDRMLIAPLRCIRNRIPPERQRKPANGPERRATSVQRRRYLRSAENHVVQLHLLLNGLLVRARSSRMPPQDTHGTERLT